MVAIVPIFSICRNTALPIYHHRNSHCVEFSIFNISPTCRACFPLVPLSPSGFFFDFSARFPPPCVGIHIFFFCEFSARFLSLPCCHPQLSAKRLLDSPMHTHPLAVSPECSDIFLLVSPSLVFLRHPGWMSLQIFLLAVGRAGGECAAIAPRGA